MGIRSMCSVKNVENHDFVLSSSINKPLPNSVRFHPKVDINVFGHLFNLYISLHMEEFDIFPNASTSDFIYHHTCEVMFLCK